MSQLPAHEKIAMHLMSYHETGSWHLDYSKIAYNPKDPGGLSVGWGQAALTTDANTLMKMFDRYVEINGPLATELAQYLPGLRAHSTSTQADQKLHALLRRMSLDPVWQGVQDRAFARYLDTARDKWQARGFTSHVAFALWVDMQIQHGGDWLANRALKAIRGEGPKAYQDLLIGGATDHYGGEWGGMDSYDAESEEDVVWATLLCRLDFLMTEGPTSNERSSWPPSTYRCNHLAWLAESGPVVWDWGMEIQTVHPHKRQWSILPSLLAG